MNLPRRPVACVTDSETGIINAMSVVPNLVDIRCWNHNLQDCGGWLTDRLIKDVPKKKQIATEEKKSLEAIYHLQGAWLDD